MITEIMGKDFKGLTFNQAVTKKTLFLGPNGAGKSARTQALTLALLGYIPGSGKTNEDILSSFGSTDVVVVGFKVDGTSFERAWGRVKESVKEGFKLNGVKVGKEAFISAVGEKGTPKVFDLNLFLDLSDQKKINYIMSLYPCGIDLSGVETMIETQKKNILTMEDKARSTEKAAATLNASRAAMSLPAGSLAETTAAIKKAEEDQESAQKELNEIKLRNAQETSKEEGKKEGKQEAIAEKQHVSDVPPFIDNTAPIKKEEGSYSEWEKEGFQTILQSILMTMDDTGCQACAARMVVKMELKKCRK
jgi:DNA repair exonuclease SbcCD ATPase subunit